MNDSMGQFLTQSHGWKLKWFASDILWEIIQVVFHQIVLSSVLDYLPYIATLSTHAISSACSQHTQRSLWCSYLLFSLYSHKCFYRSKRLITPPLLPASHYSLQDL